MPDVVAALAQRLDQELTEIGLVGPHRQEEEARAAAGFLRRDGRARSGGDRHGAAAERRNGAITQRVRPGARTMMSTA